MSAHETSNYLVVLLQYTGYRSRLMRLLLDNGMTDGSNERGVYISNCDIINNMKQPAVYILASKRNGTLYIGVTSNLVQRIHQHKNDEVEGFSKKYQTHMLVYFEQHETMEPAIIREKRLKEWKRAWKIRLIEEMNPHWKDLYNDLI